jgi:molybdenum cofactor guanylyltransferase
VTADPDVRETRTDPDVREPRPGAQWLTGVVPAGGLGRRMGVPKATAVLAGRPLISYPLEALQAVCERVAIVCKRDTELPETDAERWLEPDEPRHPRAGIVHALERAAAPVLVCAGDMPFVTPDVLRDVAGRLVTGTRAVVAVSDEGLEPLLAAYAPAALAALCAAPADEPLRRTVESLAPIRVAVRPAIVFNVNTPDDLAVAELRLRSG